MSDSTSEFDLVEYFRVVQKKKKMAVAIIVGFTLLMAIITYLKPLSYSASTTIMPIDVGQGGGLGSLLQFSGIASLTGGAKIQQQILVILKSRSLAEKVIQDNNLLPVLLKKYNPSNGVSDIQMDGAVSTLLNRHVSITSEALKGTITITAQFKDYKIATKVANSYISALRKTIQENAFTVAKRNRFFIESQLAKNKKELLEAGKELNEFYKLGRVSSIDSKIDVIINQSDNNAENVLQEGFPTEPELDAQLTTLQKEKDTIASALKQAGNGDVVKNVPQQVYLQYLTMHRNLLTQINTLLAQRYEMSKIEEAKDELLFEVIDTAKEVPKPSSNRKRVVFISFVLSLFISIFAVFSVEYFERLRVRA